MSCFGLIEENMELSDIHLVVVFGITAGMPSVENPPTVKMPFRPSFKVTKLHPWENSGFGNLFS